MSGALDEDTQQALAEGQETAKTFLRSIQKDLQKVFVVFLVAFIGTFYALRLRVWDYLRGVTAANMPPAIEEELEIIAQTPFEVILLQAKIGLVVGGLIAAPVLLYFGRDGLRERGYWPEELPMARWKIAALLLLAVGLFAVGTAYGYLVFFPVMFNFLATFGLEAGFNPSYSIVMWTEFIVFLSLSFGLAGQMPLLVSSLSYLEVVPYETFRDKWRYAVIAIFVFGAMFSPPDPFTQIMWAVPLIALYAFSLYLAKVVVTAKRGSESIDVAGSARSHWNVVLGGAGLGAALVYAFYEYGGRAAANDGLAAAGSSRRFLPAGQGLGLDPAAALAAFAAAWALLFGLIALLYAVYTDLDVTAGGQYGATDAVGDPTAIDLSELDAAGIRAAPEEAFAALSEAESLRLAQEAMDDDEPEKAQLVLDRFDEAEAAEEAPAEPDDPATADGDAGGAPEPENAVEGAATEVTDRASRAGSTFLDEFTEDEADEEDIGGYYTDLKFIVDTLRSKSFRIVATFMIVMAATFTWLYLGGLGDVRDDFLSRLPQEITPDSVTVITLHPVEALVFMVKFSVLIGLVAVLPMIAYYAWPALRDRGFVRGRRNVVFFWVFAFAAAMAGGFAAGYAYIAPTIISYLVEDALRARMIITYRINDFFWLIVFTTVGIGVLANIPVLMVMLNSVGVPYRAMRGRWREVTVALLAFAAVFTPADIVTMFLVTVPLMGAYTFGLGLLFLITLGGRRNLAEPAEIVTARLETDTS